MAVDATRGSWRNLDAIPSLLVFGRVYFQDPDFFYIFRIDADGHTNELENVRFMSVNQLDASHSTRHNSVWHHSDLKISQSCYSQELKAEAEGFEWRKILYDIADISTNHEVSPLSPKRWYKLSRKNVSTDTRHLEGVFKGRHVVAVLSNLLIGRVTKRN